MCWVSLCKIFENFLMPELAANCSYRSLASFSSSTRYVSSSANSFCVLESLNWMLMIVVGMQIQNLEVQKAENCLCLDSWDLHLKSRYQLRKLGSRSELAMRWLRWRWMFSWLNLCQVLVQRISLNKQYPRGYMSGGWQDHCHVVTRRDTRQGLKTRLQTNRCRLAIQLQWR